MSKIFEVLTKKNSQTAEHTVNYSHNEEVHPVDEREPLVQFPPLNGNQFITVTRCCHLHFLISVKGLTGICGENGRRGGKRGIFYSKFKILLKSVILDRSASLAKLSSIRPSMLFFLTRLNWSIKSAMY